MNLTQKIESYLFYTGEAVSIKKLAKVFSVAEGEISDALKMLEENLTGHGIILMRNADEAMLATHPEMGEMIQDIKKQELSDPLSKGALETLAIILYKDGATKPDIDFIRGVNSGFMLRNLQIRGLIEKVPNEDDKRITKYKGTFDALRFLGITQVSELPNFSAFATEFAKREAIGEKVEENIFTS
ncbi:MAG: scpB [Patescibacteria group bacterium]|nr:scpB [Patescibacteria group bacterium]